MKSVPSHSIAPEDPPAKKLSNKRRLEMLLKEMLTSESRQFSPQMLQNPKAFYRRVIE